MISMSGGWDQIETEAECLSAENARLRSVLDVAGLGLWSWNFEDIITLDARAQNYIGVSGSGVITVADFLVRFEESQHAPLLDALERGREGLPIDEVFQLDAHGSAKGGELRLQGQRMEGQSILSGACFLMSASMNGALGLRPEFEDATRSRLNQQLQLSSELYLELGMDGCVQWANSMSEQVLGYPLAFSQGRSFVEFLHPEDIAKARQVLERVRAGEAVEQLSMENRCRCQDGSYIWLSWAWTIDSQRDVICVIGRDVTAVKVQQAQVDATLAQLQASNTELKSFASVASHDLREPLRMISSYLRLLDERSPEALDARAQRYINYACEGADRMRGLIEDLLSYSRLDSAGQSLEPVALDEVLEGAIDNLSVAIKHASAEVTVDINNSPVVSGDRNRLVRLFQNLLANAIKFHRDGSTPRVAVRFTDGNFAGEPEHWVITIKDNGIGIDPDHQDLLFNAFQRLNTRDEFDGSGIGLAVCKKIVEQHHGRIWVASELDVGSTFYVTLAKLATA